MDWNWTCISYRLDNVFSWQQFNKVLKRRENVLVFLLHSPKSTRDISLSVIYWQKEELELLKLIPKMCYTRKLLDKTEFANLLSKEVKHTSQIVLNRKIKALKKTSSIWWGKKGLTCDVHKKDTVESWYYVIGSYLVCMRITLFSVVSQAASEYDINLRVS